MPILNYLQTHRRVALALFNRASAPALLSTTAQALRLPQGRRYIVRDLWTHKSTVTRRKIAARVKSHQVKLFRVSVAGAKSDGSR